MGLDALLLEGDMQSGTDVLLLEMCEASPPAGPFSWSWKATPPVVCCASRAIFNLAV